MLETYASKNLQRIYGEYMEMAAHHTSPAPYATFDTGFAEGAAMVVVTNGQQRAGPLKELWSCRKTMAQNNPDCRLEPQKVPFRFPDLREIAFIINK